MNERWTLQNVTSGSAAVEKWVVSRAMDDCGGQVPAAEALPMRKPHETEAESLVGALLAAFLSMFKLVVYLNSATNVRAAHPF
jgi:hypothetical protein